MNPSLHALMTKLRWKLQDLESQLHQSEKNSALLQEQIRELDNRVSPTRDSSLTQINPEIEISRLNFMMQLQQQKEILLNTLNQEENTKNQLNTALSRIKIELRMLEKYLQKEHDALNKIQQKLQEHALDEWVLQKRISHEN